MMQNGRIFSYWIDTLVLKLREILALLYCITLSSSREKPAQAQEVAGRISSTVAGEIYVKPTVPIIKLSFLALHYSPFASRFHLPHF